MIVLGIETSGSVGSVALRRDGRCEEECLLPELGRRHARSLIPEIVTFLGRRGLELKDVDAFAVSVGPGSFTGLRVGVTFAKTAAYALDRPLVAVETFSALAAQCDPAASVAVLADAQRRGVMFGYYERTSGGGYERRGEIVLVAREELPDALRDVELVTGATAGLDFAASGQPALAPSRVNFPRAATIARLGAERITRGELADAWTLEPSYVRKSGAEETREERASGGLGQ
jgi:tRNA threonylcarbamoyladenosine biosynthesis protein TsaB